MRRIVLILIVTVLALSAKTVTAQVYAKLNGLYALVGVINPAVEFKLSPKSTFQSELVYCPYESVTIDNISGPLKFGIFMNEYRRYFKQHNNGLYLAANAGVMTFNMTKPTFTDGKLALTPKSSKGYGFMFGIAAGYEMIFKEKWLLDFFIGWSFTSSFYNGYSLVDGLNDGGEIYNKGEIIMTPNRPIKPTNNDPFNGSSEWMPNKAGVSIGFLIFDPQKHK